MEKKNKERKNDVVWEKGKEGRERKGKTGGDKALNREEEENRQTGKSRGRKGRG